jgi:WD40 repeat protein
MDVTSQCLATSVYSHGTGGGAALPTGSSASVTCLAAGTGSSARLLASGAHDGTIRIWANSGNQVQQSVPAAWTPGPLLHAHAAGAVSGLAWLGDGRLVSVGEDGGVRVWAPAVDQ